MASAAAGVAVGIRDLSVTCDGALILQGVGLDVAEGEWVTIIGPNGAGKSTMLRAIGGLLDCRGASTVFGRSPDCRGAITVFGRSLPDLSRRARARLVASVAQNPVAPQGIRVLDYVLLGRTPYLPPLGRESRSDLVVCMNTLERMDLTRFAARPLDTLSGGERQRAFLARALAQEPRILLLDEPTTALDIGHQQDTLELVDQLRQAAGLTVIATTHELSVAGEYADRLVLLADGQVAALGRPEEVLTEDLLARHYGARVRVVRGDRGPVVIPVRARPLH